MNPKKSIISHNLSRVYTMAMGCALLSALSGNARATAVVTSASGPLAADIATAVTDFRTSIALGGGNNNVGGSFPNGFRNINWDGVGDALSDPNQLPGNFFNANSPRGLLMTTPGAGFLLSAKAVNPSGTPIEFGSIDPSYPNSFEAFTAERLFIAVGSTITDNQFFVPNNAGTAASVFGFGVVFSDVDIFGSTSLEFFDLNGLSLGLFNAPAQNNGFSFLGVSFDEGELVGSVRITSGNAALGAGILDGGAVDVVAMDDFMYSEPQALVPEPGTAAFILLGLGGLGAMRRRSFSSPVAA